MPMNVEIKARVRDMVALKRRVETLAEGEGEMLCQEDIFFHVPQGRLKLRLSPESRGQLIYYEREDATGPTSSTYHIYPTSDPASLQQVLAASLGVRGTVRKRRLLYWLQNTRIHLDQVRGLGDFMELEVVLRDGQTPTQGRARALELMGRLGIAESDLVEGAYIDLLEKKRP
ncbi:MAG: class IV adenylate cyclase [Chloroflexota bacterium]|nr:class IV adenylate cyclase [Chloroflexota bacterium]